jgi:hypothetical protein
VQQQERKLEKQMNRNAVWPAPARVSHEDAEVGGDGTAAAVVNIGFSYVASQETE